MSASATEFAAEIPAKPNDPPPRLTRWALLIGAGVFATTMSQPSVLNLPFENLLKSNLHVSRQAMASFFAINTIAWSLKPLAGILTDSVPLFGTRRRHYLIASALGAGFFWGLIGIVPRTYGSLMTVLIAMNVMLVIGSTVIGGVMVENGQRNRATGRLNSAISFVGSACLLLGGPLGGFLAARAFGLTAITGAAISVSVVPFVWYLLREPPIQRKSVEAWKNAKVQFWSLMKSRSLWIAAALLFLVYIAPGFSTALYYYQTDTLKLSQQFIGLLALLGGAFGLAAALLYGFLCQRIALRWLLVLGIILSTIGSLDYLFYRSGTAAAIIESANGFAATIVTLALLDLAARATPFGSEALGFALMMSVLNIAQSLSDVFGSWLIDQHHVSFFKLVWLNAGSTALVLMMIPFLPGVLVNQSDARSKDQGEPLPGT